MQGAQVFRKFPCLGSLGAPQPSGVMHVEVSGNYYLRPVCSSGLERVVQVF